MKGPNFWICYRRISITLESVIAGFNCIYEENVHLSSLSLLRESSGSDIHGVPQLRHCRDDEKG